MKEIYIPLSGLIVLPGYIEQVDSISISWAWVLFLIGMSISITSVWFLFKEIGKNKKTQMYLLQVFLLLTVIGLLDIVLGIYTESSSLVEFLTKYRGDQSPYYLYNGTITESVIKWSIVTSSIYSIVFPLLFLFVSFIKDKLSTTKIIFIDKPKTLLILGCMMVGVTLFLLGNNILAIYLESIS